MVSQVQTYADLHWVDGPKDQGEPGNGAEERSGLFILVLNHTTAIEGELVDNDQVSNTSHGVPSPFGTLLDGEGSKETGQNHDHISDNGHKDIGTAQPSEQAKVQEQEWGGDAPVDVTGPVDLAVDGLEGVGKMFLGVLNSDFILANTIMYSHGEIGDGGKGSDKGSQDVEQAFLLDEVSVHEGYRLSVEVWNGIAYDWDTEGHCIEGDGRDEHNDEHNPNIHKHGCLSLDEEKTCQRVRLPTSPASW